MRGVDISGFSLVVVDDSNFVTFGFHFSFPFVVVYTLSDTADIWEEKSSLFVRLIIKGSFFRLICFDSYLLSSSRLSLFIYTYTLFDTLADCNYLEHKV